MTVWKSYVLPIVLAVSGGIRAYSQSIVVLAMIAIAVSAGIVAVFGPVSKIKDAELALFGTVFLNSKHSSAVPVTVIDIDDRTHLAWGAPSDTPRERLFAIVERLIPLRPVTIVIDIDLSTKSEEEADVLSEFLQRNAADNTRSPILLVAKLTSASDMQSIARSPGNPKVDAAARPERGVSFVSAFMKSDDDATFREWFHFQALCAESPVSGISSVALAAEVIRREGRTVLRDLSDRLGSETQNSCFGIPPPEKKVLPWLEITRSPKPIVYYFGWSSDSGGPLSMTIGKNGLTPLLIKLSARDLESTAEIAVDSIRDRVVIVGASHANSQDFHRTPLGWMPGVYILANTIAGAQDAFATDSYRRIKALLIAIGLFIICAMAIVFFQTGTDFVVVAAVLGLAISLSLFFELPFALIQDSVLNCLAMLVAFAIIFKAVKFAASFFKKGKNRRRWYDLFVSETGKKMFR